MFNSFKLTVILLFLACNIAQAQHNYYEPKSPAPPSPNDDDEKEPQINTFTPPDLRSKFGLEAQGAGVLDIKLVPVVFPSNIKPKVFGAGWHSRLGVFIAVGSRIHLKAGFSYFRRPTVVEYSAVLTNGTTNKPIIIEEGGSLTYFGNYTQVEFNLGEKINIGGGIEYSFIRKYLVNYSVFDQNRISQPQYNLNNQDTSIVFTNINNTIELNAFIQYKWELDPKIIVKPFIEIAVSAIPVYQISTPSGPFTPSRSFNISRAGIKLGVIFELGLF